MDGCRRGKAGERRGTCKHYSTTFNLAVENERADGPNFRAQTGTAKNIFLV